MIEKKAESTVMLSEALVVTVSMTLGIDFRPRDQGIGIQGPLMLVPDERMEKIYSDGLRAGVFRAVEEAHEALATNGLFIKLISWQIPEALGEDELARLANELEKMTYKILYPILAEKAKRRKGHQ
jgi:hypothetical protein